MTRSAANDLSELYADNKACASLVGLHYIEGELPGVTRKRAGRGFVYYHNGTRISDQRLRKQIAELIIPPAWTEVWISPDDKGHILATGIDDKGRKQYIYHPKWRTMRDLIKFYRLLMFGSALPRIRRVIQESLTRPNLDREKVLGTMLWLLDNTYLRVGNDIYYQENESVGLSTLTDKNLIIAGNIITLFFKGKSGKHQQLAFEDARISRILKELVDLKGARLFRYRLNDTYRDISSSDINSHLQEITGIHISAKDFRTWGGTLMAFNHLVETYKLPDEKTPKPEKVAVQAVDAAANVLGNTRSIARSSYIHPDILAAYAEEGFAQYYEEARKVRQKKGLDKRETELVSVLEQLFKKEFTILQKS